ncbi:hypothetical protein [Granulicoccus sp. GXG6511]|uniref:hypothetical protein n=1 Tax=Granulicoccus sp. GXG6511 TaxID=3381351 RepID=UPI003D7E1732
MTPSLSEWVRRIFGTRPTSDDIDSADLAVTDGSDGLPFGVEPLPESRLGEIDWATEIAENARLGIPRPGGPLWQLPLWERLQHYFAADMHDWSRWRDAQPAALASLSETADGRITDLTNERDRRTAEISRAEQDLADQRAELSEPQLKYPRAAAAVSTLLVLGIATGAIVEWFALQPVVAHVFVADPRTSGGLTALAVLTIGYGSWHLGGLLHERLAHEGPPRQRRALTVGIVLLGIFALLFLVAVVGIRLSASDDSLATLDRWAGAALYAAVQGLVQGVAMLHGWMAHNPRVKEIRATEQHIAQLRSESQDVTEALDETREWAAALAEFDAGAWLVPSRAALAHEYAAAVQEHSEGLGRALLEAQHVESADFLELLPRPQFDPPAETQWVGDPDWVAGFVIPL